MPRSKSRPPEQSGTGLEVGEYELRRRSAQAAARTLFLDAVSRCEPEVLKSLLRGPFAAVQRGKDWMPPKDPEQLPQAMRAWLHRWNLPCPPQDAEWCWNCALETMAYWQTHADDRGKKWAPQTRSRLARALPPEALQFTFALEEEQREWGGNKSAMTRARFDSATRRSVLRWWDPEVERKTDALRRIRNAFDEVLRAHVAAVEALLDRGREKDAAEPDPTELIKIQSDPYRTALLNLGLLDLACDKQRGAEPNDLDVPIGFQRAPTKHERQHFEWLARYQVNGESVGAIANSVHQHRQTVMDGIRSAADLVGMTLRPPARGGRPRKK